MKALLLNGTSITLIPIVLVTVFFMVILNPNQKKIYYDTVLNIFENLDSKVDSFVEENTSLLAQGLTSKVINNLLRYDFPEEKEQFKDEVVLLSNRYETEKSNRRKGIGQNDTEMNQINNNLLEILKNI